MKMIIRSFAAAMVVASFFANVSHAVETAPLYTIQKTTYQLSVTGKVLSAGALPAGTKVYFEVRPVGGKPLEWSTIAAADGSFTMTVFLNNHRNEQVDWRLSAKGGLLSSIAQEGRQILADDTNIGLEKSVDLTEQPVVVALR